MKLRDAAGGIMATLQQSQPAQQFDPAIILIIIQALKILLPMVLEYCDKEPDEVPTLAARMLQPASVADRIAYWMAYRSLQRELGWRQYQLAGGSAMLRAILSGASESKPEDVESLYNSISILGGQD